MGSEQETHGGHGSTRREVKAAFSYDGGKSWAPEAPGRNRRGALVHIFRTSSTSPLSAELYTAMSCAQEIMLYPMAMNTFALAAEGG